MQESTGASDHAFQQCIVCCGIDPAPASHFPQLPVMKIDEETQRLGADWRIGGGAVKQ